MTEPLTGRDLARRYLETDSLNGARLTLIVACSVFRGKSTSKINLSADKLGKISILEFAELSQTSHNRIRRHLDCWERAMAAGLVPDHATLTPEDVETFDLTPELIEALADRYDATRSATGGSPKPLTVEAIEAAVADLGPEDGARVAQALKARMDGLAARGDDAKAVGRHITLEELLDEDDTPDRLPPVGELLDSKGNSAVREAKVRTQIAELRRQADGSRQIIEQEMAKLEEYEQRIDKLLEKYPDVEVAA